MGVFDLLFGKRQSVPVDVVTDPSESDGPEIPKDLFVEERDPKDIPLVEGMEDSPGIQGVYAYMLSDFEGKGYRDALANSDLSSRDDNVRLLHLGLQIRIDQSKLYYEDRIKEIVSHINSRSQAGLNDLAQDLDVRRKIYSGHLEALENLKKELASGDGTTFRVVHSYMSGFKRGLATITHAKILNGDN